MDLLSYTIPNMECLGKRRWNVLRLLCVLTDCIQNVPAAFFSSVFQWWPVIGFLPFSLYLLITLNRHRYDLATFLTLFFSLPIVKSRSLLFVQLNLLNSLAYGRIISLVVLNIFSPIVIYIDLASLPWNIAKIYWAFAIVSDTVLNVMCITLFHF